MQRKLMQEMQARVERMGGLPPSSRVFFIVVHVARTWTGERNMNGGWRNAGVLVDSEGLDSLTL